jgi:hypothetical protein
MSIHEEPLITLQAAAEWTRSRSGRKPHIATVYRWALRGVNGRRLETVFVGRTRMTSEGAIQRFMDAPVASPPVHDCDSGSGDAAASAALASRIFRSPTGRK